LARIAAAVAAGTVRHLLVFGEDVTPWGMDERVLGSLETLAVSDVLPNPTTARAQWLFPGCAAVEKRGTFINAKGRVQRFLKAMEGPGDARPEVETLMELEAALGGAPVSTTLEGLFNRMAREVPGLAGVEWGKLGELGVAVAL
jgi:predicted molibdopterin-dependent oxidoreductase YjgC